MDVCLVVEMGRGHEWWCAAAAGWRVHLAHVGTVWEDLGSVSVSAAEEPPPSCSLTWALEVGSGYTVI